MPKYNSCANGCQCTDENAFYIENPDELLELSQAEHQEYQEQSYNRTKSKIQKRGNCKCSNCPSRTCASSFYAFFTLFTSVIV